MKKLFALLLVTMMVFSLVACGGDKKEKSTNASVTKAANNTDSTSTDNGNGENQVATNPVQDVFHAATSSATGAYATIKVSADVKMDDTTAWLGLCPAGKDYITELEADEVDVIYFYAEYREDGDPYVFACDFENVEDGTYALIVATSDDENVGYVVIQLTMTKSGDKLSFDFENAKLKQRPSK